MNQNTIIIFLALVLLGLYFSKSSSGILNLTGDEVPTNMMSQSSVPIYQTTQSVQPTEPQSVPADTFSHSNMNPYFGSKLTQPMKRSVNLSNYTGSVDDRHSTKMEVENDFKNTIIDQGQTNSQLTREYYNVSNYMQSELPFRQELVGKGMGVGSNVASSGGFHQDVRIIPPQWGCTNTNRDEFDQMNQFAQTQGTSNRMNYRNELTNTNRQHGVRDVLPTKTAINSSRLREDDKELLNDNFVSENCHIGIPFSSVKTNNWETPIQELKTQNRGDYEDCNFVGQPSVGTGGAIQKTDNIQYQNNRDSTACDSAFSEINITGATKTPNGLKVDQNKRIQLSQFDSANIKGGVEAHLTNNQSEPQSTNRETYSTHIVHNNVSNQIQDASQNLNNHYELCPPVTQRDQINISVDSDNRTATGPANSIQKAHQLNYNEILSDMDVYHKREQTAINQQQPGPQNINNRQERIEELLGTNTLSVQKSDQYTSYNRVNLENIVPARSLDPPKPTYNVNRLEIENERVVSDAVSNKKVLSSNKLHNPII